MVKAGTSEGRKGGVKRTTNADNQRAVSPNGAPSCEKIVRALDCVRMHVVCRGRSTANGWIVPHSREGILLCSARTNELECRE